MPYKIKKDARCPVDKPWAMVKTSNPSEYMCHATEDDANAHVRAIMAGEAAMMKTADMMMSGPISHFSEEPWNKWTESDYTLEQWHNACLIHQHEGPPTSKSQCKLPIKTPSGVVNKNGVFAAAAALAGARTPMNASANEKKAAAKKLLRQYAQMEADPPESLKKMAGMMHSEDGAAVTAQILQHFGIKGQKWGVRRSREELARVNPSEDSARVEKAKAKVVGGNTAALSNKELQDVVTRMNLEQQFSRLNAGTQSAGKKFAKEILVNVAKQQVTTLASKAATKAVASAMG